MNVIPATLSSHARSNEWILILAYFLIIPSPHPISENLDAAIFCKLMTVF